LAALLKFSVINKAKFTLENNAAFSQTTAKINRSMKWAHLIIETRILNLDCMPMSGFDNSTEDYPRRPKLPLELATLTL
jgi:hypothetical protein